MNDLPKDLEQEFYDNCCDFEELNNINKTITNWKKYVEPEDILEFLSHVYSRGLKAGREEERERIKKIVDSVKQDIRMARRVNTLYVSGEKLDLITKPQAINAINLSGLPYTYLSPNQNTKE